jgi:ABC-type dipeptide/oligopeptide/nickel transport system ATPase component
MSAKTKSTKKNKPFELVNIYEEEAIKPFLLKSHNPGYDMHYIEVPFRMLIIGSSGSGKTLTLYNILRIFSGTFQNIHIIAKSINEPIYKYIEDRFKKINDNPKTKSKLNVQVLEGMNSLPDLTSFDEEEQSLVVLDDLVLEKNQKKIEEYYIRCRKLNVSIIYISQSYFAIPKIIRQNVSYMIIKQVSAMRNLKLISNEYSLALNSDQLTKVYEFCTQQKSDFMLIDIDHKDMRFRKNFTFVIDIDALQR